MKHKSLVESSIILAKTLGLGMEHKTLAFYLAAVSFPSDFKKMLTKTLKKPYSKREQLKAGVLQINMIEIALNKYSKSIIEEFLSVPEIRVLVTYYLDRVKIPEYEKYSNYLLETSLVLAEVDATRELADTERFEKSLITIMTE